MNPGTLQLPRAFEAEQALIGALLYTPDPVMQKCRDAGLTTDDFDVPAHRVVFSTVVEMMNAGEGVDPTSVAAHLKRLKVPGVDGKPVKALEFVGGLQALMTLEDQRGVTAVAGQYAAEIISVGLSREMVRVGWELEQKGAELAPIAEVVTSAERRLAAARDRADGRASGEARQSDAAELLQRVLEHYISPEPDDLIPFQLPTLNSIGGGMAPGDVVVVGARSGVGKSWWGLDTAEQVLQVGRRVALFSLEMPAQQMMRRLLAMGGLNLTGLKKRALPYDSMTERIGVIDAWRGLLDIEDGSTNIDRIHTQLTTARIEGRPYRLVIVDHLHLVDVPGGAMAYRLELNKALTRLKHMAVEHGATIVLLAQLLKPMAGTDRHKRPTMFDLRESNGIGDIADYVLMLHREPGEDGYPTNQGVVIVDKVRDGAGACDIDVVFDPRTYRFREGFMAGFSPTRRLAA